MTDPQDRLTGLEDFLAGTNEETPEETLKELRKSKVDVKQFLQRVEQTVQEGYTKQLQKIATGQQSESPPRPSFLENLSNLTREEMLGCFERLGRGEFGAENKEAVLARCRNKDTSKLTDEELRSWLEDVGEIIGEQSE